MENLGTMKITKEFKKFLRKLQGYRVSQEIDEIPISLCYLPNVVVKYFKENNDRYLELVEMEADNGTN